MRHSALLWVLEVYLNNNVLDVLVAYLTMSSVYHKVCIHSSEDQTLGITLGTQPPLGRDSLSRLVVLLLVAVEEMVRVAHV